MFHNFLVLLGFAAALTATSETAAAAGTDICEAPDAATFAVSVLPEAELERLLAQVRPATQRACVTGTGPDARCRAHAPGGTPGQPVVRLTDSTKLGAPKPVAPTAPDDANASYARAHDVALCRGYARELDRPPQR